MKKAVFTLICSLVFAAGVMAQDAPLDVSKRVADYLLSHHNHNVSKTQDGHTHIDSYYQEWRYVNGVLGVAMLNLADAADERSMSSLSKRTLTFISNQKYSDNSGKNTDWACATMRGADSSPCRALTTAELWALPSPSWHDDTKTNVTRIISTR